MEQKRKFDLEERLIEFAVMIITISENLVNSKAGTHMGSQLVRSGTSPALHYGEAQSAESRAGFIHKLKILLKELRESQTAMRIILKAKLSPQVELIDKAIVEANELISIFFKSVDTARKNLNILKQG